MLDALGLAQLVKRKGDLQGSVPLRAAQGCAPLLEGNAFGFQIALRQPITLLRESGRLRVMMTAPFGEALAAAHRAVIPRLVAQGLLAATDPLAALFGETFFKVDADHCGIRLWTGLLVQAKAGIALRVSATANRHNRLIRVDEQIVEPAASLTPLFLAIALRRDAPDRVVLDGEIGTVAPVIPDGAIDEATLADAPEIGAAHASFYDEAYFSAKRVGITRKYRKVQAAADPGDGDVTARSRVISIGPAHHAVTGRVRRITFVNRVAFEARFDGYGMTIDADQRALRSGTRAVEQAFAEAMGPTFLGMHPRAMLYFTKYFTFHPRGEAHFFVKPWAFVQTPPGWSCLLEGVQGDGFDVLRGVVATDVFHTTPAVFELFATGVTLAFEAGAPLLQAIPIPRRLLAAGFRELPLRA